MREPNKDTPPPESASAPQTERVGILLRLGDGRRFAVGVGGLRVGRQQGMGVVLTDRTVSRHHADVRYENGRYVLYDQSKNGTWVNGRLVAAAQPVRGGDVVKFGQVEFRFEVQSVSKAEVAALLDATQPSQVPRSSTARMKGAKPPRRWKRFSKRRSEFWRLVSLLLITLVIAAGFAVYQYAPELFDELVGHLPAAIRGR